MKKLLLFSLLLCVAPLALAQDVNPFADYTLMLVSPIKDVVPIVPVINSQQKLEYIPVNEIQSAFEKGSTPIHLRQVLELLANLSLENQRLQDENQKLWKIAENSSERPKQTVVVQAPPPDPGAQRRALLQQMLLMNMANQPKPYQLPAPVPPVHINCTSNKVGDSTYTNCNQ